MDIQRLRNITTAILHTCMSDVYDDIEILTGVRVMTHEIPTALNYIQSCCKGKLDVRFFNQKFDKDHIGDIYIEPLDQKERNDFLDLLLGRKAKCLSQS